MHIITSMVSNEVNVENTNTSGSDEISDLNSPIFCEPTDSFGLN